MIFEIMYVNCNKHHVITTNTILSRSYVQRSYVLKPILDLTLKNQNNIGILVYCITCKLFLKTIYN